MGEEPPTGFQIGIELTSDAIVIADARGKVTFANPAAEQVFGIGCVLGQYMETLFETVSETTAVYVTRAAEGNTQRVSAVVRRLDGERRSVVVQLAPVSQDGAGGSRGVIAVVRDVTDEARARQAVTKSEARYRNIFDGASDAIYTIDANGVFTSVNGATCRMVGYTAEELIGRSLVPFLDDAEIPMIIEHVRAVREMGESRHYECHFTRSDGVRLLCSVTNTPVRSDTEIVGVLGIARDVSDQRRAAMERDELRRQLTQSQKLEAIGQLVSGVAHELNNPLAAVMAYAQLIAANRVLPDEERSAVETIIQETKRAARIVSNLLTFARQHQPERSVTDINQVVTDTLALRRYSLEERRVMLNLELDEQLPLTWADSFQVQQVLLNLMANAEHALDGWSGERWIRVATHHVDSTIRLVVSDSGPGIDEKILHQIFNPFFTTKSLGEGTGLGLSIADGIVREHGGHIRVRSRLHQGATFIVELPIVDPVAEFLHGVDRTSVLSSAMRP